VPCVVLTSVPRADQKRRRDEKWLITLRLGVERVEGLTGFVPTNSRASRTEVSRFEFMFDPLSAGLFAFRAAGCLHGSLPRVW
jgi:hypothetical protein